MAEVVASMSGAMDAEVHAVAGDPHTEGTRPARTSADAGEHG
jgi:hypothetical protein